MIGQEFYFPEEYTSLLFWCISGGTEEVWGGGGVRPIAVGCSLRRLVAKVAGFMVVEDMAALLAP